VTDPTPASSTTIDPSVAWEWNGTLSKVTGDATLFALYLAMQQSALADPIKIANIESEFDDLTQQLAQINFYRTAPLSATKSDWTNLTNMGQLIATEHFEDARLLHTMHPLPLAQFNDSMRLSEHIISNCSLATQKRLAAEYTSTFAEDNTLLSEIIPQSLDILAA